MKPITDYQRRVLDYLEAYRSEHGYYPTQAEQARQFNVARSSARAMRRSLQRAGLLAVDGGWRGLRVIEGGQQPLPAVNDEATDRVNALVVLALGTHPTPRGALLQALRVAARYGAERDEAFLDAIERELATERARGQAGGRR